MIRSLLRRLFACERESDAHNGAPGNDTRRDDDGDGDDDDKRDDPRGRGGPARLPDHYIPYPKIR